MCSYIFYVQHSLYFTTLYFKAPFIIRLVDLVPKGNFFVLNMLNDLYFMTTFNIRPHFHGPMSGLKIEGPPYLQVFTGHSWLLVFYSRYIQDSQDLCELSCWSGAYLQAQTKMPSSGSHLLSARPWKAARPTTLWNINNSQDIIMVKEGNKVKSASVSVTAEMTVYFNIHNAKLLAVVLVGLCSMYQFLQRSQKGK